MRNKLIDDLIPNHSPALLLEQERMQALDAKEMESSSKIDLKVCRGKCPSKMLIDVGN